MQFIHLVASPSIAGVINRAIAFEGYEIQSTAYSQDSVICTASSHSSTPLIPVMSPNTSGLVESTISDTTDCCKGATQSAMLSETSPCFTVTITSTTISTKTVNTTHISGPVVTVTTEAVAYNTIASPANYECISSQVGPGIANSSYPTLAGQTKTTADVWSTYGAAKSGSRTFSVSSNNATMPSTASFATASTPISPYIVQKNSAVENEVALVLLLMGYSLAARIGI